MSEATKAIPLSLRRKSSARMAAVQCLYQRVIMSDEQSAEGLLTNYLDQWKDDKSSDDPVMSKRDPDPDAAFLRKLLTAVLERKEELDAIITKSLTDKWKMERMSPVLIAILECAIAELTGPNAPAPAIVINEYVTLTGRFFEQNEQGFVNGLLDTLAKQTPKP